MFSKESSTYYSASYSLNFNYAKLSVNVFIFHNFLGQYRTSQQDFNLMVSSLILDLVYSYAVTVVLLIFKQHLSLIQHQ